MRTRAPMGCSALIAAMICGCRPTWSARVSSEGNIERPGEPSLKYRVLGNGGDTVVVVHGGPGLHMKYLLQPFTPLTDRHTLIFYDLRGRGESGVVADSTRLTADLDVSDLDAVRLHFHLDKVNLIGHHWGAAVAGMYAIQHPDRVNRMVLVSPYPVHRSLLFAMSFVAGDSALWTAIRNEYGKQRTPEQTIDFCKRFWPAYFTPLAPHPATPYADLAQSICDDSPTRLQEASRTQRWIGRSLSAIPWREGLNQTRVPTLVIEGDGDSTVYQAAKRWAQHLPDAELLMLNPPYLFPWVSDPPRFMRAVEEFLGGAWPEQAAKPERFMAPGQAGTN